MFSDFRYAWRRLRAEPLISLAAVATLALGVGATVVMGDVLDRLLFRPPAHIAEPHRVVRLYDSTPGPSIPPLRIGWQSLQVLQSDATDVFESAAAYLREERSLGLGAAARKVRIVTHSDGYFRVLGLVPYMGRLPAPGDPDAGRQAVISHGVWRDAFGAAADVLGRSVDIGVDAFEIVAVTPPGFVGIDAEPTDVWLPLETRGESAIYPGWNKRNDALLSHAVARLQTGASATAAAARVEALLEPLLVPKPRAFGVTLGDVSPTRAPTLSADVRVALLTTGMSLLVLLVACGNTGNLLLVRRLRRAQDVSIKMAMGATRGRLVREVTAEAMLIAVLAGTLTLALTVAGARIVHDVFLPGLTDITPLATPRLVALTMLVSLVGAFVLALAPVWWQTRQRITSDNAAARVARPTRLLDVFVALQVAFSLPLVAAAALFVSSLWNAQAHDFGLQTGNVVVVETNTAEIGRPHDAHAVHLAIQERLRHLPGIEAVSVVQSVPTQGRMGFRVRPVGAPDDAGRFAPFVAADPAYVDVAGIRVVEGRALTAADDTPEGLPVAIVSASLARDAWPGRSAVGECLEAVGTKRPCMSVVGVFADVADSPSLTWRRGASGGWAVIAALQPLAATSRRVVLARTTQSPSSMLSTIRREAQIAAANQPYVDVWPLDDVFEPMLRPWRTGSTVFAAFGLVTLLVAAVGLAVVTAYGVTRRTREIGIRAALGAEPADLVALLVRQNLAATGMGLTAGLALAWIAGRWLESLLYGISPHDVRVLLAVVAVLVVVTAVAAWLPARRAGRVDPAAALRVE